MAQPASNDRTALLAQHLVRYVDLRPCTTAFIDTRTPGSAQKENFTIIGPGVAENPDQYVHIDIPHGFNIGGARQPPGCVNSQHSHDTAEVFIVHSGTWSFCAGPDGEDGEVTLRPGDTISIPTDAFRGFRNAGDDTGFLFAVLGGDDPGRVTWAPYVFENARKHGLILVDDGSLVDTTRGQKLRPDQQPMPATTEADLHRFTRLMTEDLERCVVRHEQLDAKCGHNDTAIQEISLLGGVSNSENTELAPLDRPHGFQVRYLRIAPGASTESHVRHEEEVILMHRGELAIHLPGCDLTVGPGDVFTVPINMPRTFANNSRETVLAYVVRGGDDPLPPTVTE